MVEGIFKELIETLLGNPFTPIEWEGYTPYSDLPARKPLEVHHEISVQPKSLERLVGRYSPSAELVLVVTRKEDHLQLSENGQAPMDLVQSRQCSSSARTPMTW